VRTSTSWRLLGPVRVALRMARSRGRHDPPPAPPAPPAPTAAAPRLPVAPTPAASARSGTPVRAVHQFHSGSAPHDAITNALFLIRGLLRDLGYASEIYVEHRHPALADECRRFDELPTHADYVLIVHHSLGYGVYDHIVALPAVKVVLYHNITPAALLAAHPHVQENAVLGRVQLADLRRHTVAALADSDYNALELRALGFDPVRTCTLLFDPRRPRAAGRCSPSCSSAASRSRKGRTRWSPLSPRSARAIPARPGWCWWAAMRTITIRICRRWRPASAPPG
jgi:hypothetical protein